MVFFSEISGISKSLMINTSRVKVVTNSVVRIGLLSARSVLIWEKKNEEEKGIEGMWVKEDHKNPSNVVVVWRYRHESKRQTNREGNEKHKRDGDTKTKPNSLTLTLSLSQLSLSLTHTLSLSLSRSLSFCWDYEPRQTCVRMHSTTGAAACISDR